MAKLSAVEAVRRGTRLYPTQRRGAFWSGAPGPTGQACVLGAMMAGAGMPVVGPFVSPVMDHVRRAALRRRVRMPPDRVVRCPTRCGMWREWWTITLHLNDGHAWTRERIARWLDRLRRAERVRVRAKDVATTRLTGGAR